MIEPTATSLHYHASSQRHHNGPLLNWATIHPVVTSLPAEIARRRHQRGFTGMRSGQRRGNAGCWRVHQRNDPSMRGALRTDLANGL